MGIGVQPNCCQDKVLYTIGVDATTLSSQKDFEVTNPTESSSPDLWLVQNVSRAFGINWDLGRLYFGQTTGGSQSLSRVDIDGNHLTTLVGTGSFIPVDATFDYDSDRIYVWGSTLAPTIRHIRSYASDGSGMTVVKTLTAGHAITSNVAFDRTHQVLIYGKTNLVNNVITKCDLAGNETEILSGGGDPTILTIQQVYWSERDQMVYFTSSGNSASVAGTVRKCNISGGNTSTIVTMPNFFVLPRGLQVDGYAGKVFYGMSNLNNPAGAAEQGIYKANIDGSDQKKIIDHTKIYHGNADHVGMFRLGGGWLDRIDDLWI